MLFAGIDVGSLTAEGVIVNNGNILAYQQMSVRPNPVDSAREVMDQALAKAGLDWKDISYSVATGYGREQIQSVGMAQENISEISCHGFGAFCLANSVRTVVDIGGQDAKVIRLNKNGDLENFVMNDKCAAGTGHFLEVMSRALDTSLDALGPLSQGSRDPVKMSNRCSIFVETEVIHCLQRGVSKTDIAAGISIAMAERVFALVRRVGLESEVMMTGGVAKNIGVKSALEKLLKVRMLTPKIDPQIIGAFGAAMFAQKQGGAQ